VIINASSDAFIFAILILVEVFYIAIVAVYNFCIIVLFSM